MYVKYFLLVCCLFGLTRGAPTKKEDKLPVRLYQESGREANDKKEALSSEKDDSNGGNTKRGRLSILRFISPFRFGRRRSRKSSPSSIAEKEVAGL